MSVNGLVSVVLPAYRAEFTISRCLQLVSNQTNAELEIIVVDSSEDDRTGRVVRSEFPEIHYHHNPQRLLPHEAQGMGVTMASGEYLLLMDPDIYPPPDWIYNLMKARQKMGGVVTGSLRSYGTSPMEMGRHLCKFDLWLPRGATRPTKMCPTANLLCLKQDYERVGGLSNGTWLGDLLLSWSFLEAGVRLWFVPHIVADHHHLGGLRDLLGERFVRGVDFSRHRRQHESWGLRQELFNLLVTIFPFRLIGLLWRGCLNSHQAGYTGSFVVGFPIIASGQFFWLAGEAFESLRRLIRRGIQI